MARNGLAGVCPYGGADWSGERLGGHGANPLSGDGLGRARRVESRPAEAGKTHPENFHKLLLIFDL